MISIADILKVEHIDLDVKVASTQAAELATLSLLRGDARIKDWNAFSTALSSRTPGIASGSGFGVRIPHARTDAVSEMVMAVGRCKTALLDPASAEAANEVTYIFVIGVPLALVADYLRIVGSIARFLRDPAQEGRLRAAATPEEFLALLSRFEVRV